jgi:hypothetical protein
MDQSLPRRAEWSLVLGVILLVIGLLFLLDNLDVIYIGTPVSHFWPLIIVAIGIGKILQSETAWERRRGFVWVFIGLWFLVSVLHMFGLSFHNSWPLLLIGLGINAIWKAMTQYPENRLSKG